MQTSWILVLTASCLGAVLAKAAEVPAVHADGPISVGAAMVDITPTHPVPKGGAYQAFMTEGVMTPLEAHAVSWGRGADAMIWVSLDVTGIEDSVAAYFRQHVATKTGVPADRVFISATHTHGAPADPRFSIYRTQKAQDEVMQLHRGIADKAAEAAVTAYRNRRPARMGHGSGHAERATFNRRYIMSNGRTVMGGNAPGLTRVEVEGPVDDRVEVIWFEDAASADVITVLVNFAAHPSMMYSMKQLGAEYPGFMREAVCRALGRDIPIVFLQGACGNTIASAQEGDRTWGRGEDGMRTIGTILAGVVIEQVSNSQAMATDAMPFTIATTTVRLEYRKFGNVDETRILAVLREGEHVDDKRTFFDDHFTSLTDKALVRAIALRDHMQRRNLPPEITIQAIRLGPVGFLATPAGNAFVEFQIALKAAFPDNRVVWVDLTNGCTPYIPTTRGAALGGYEAESAVYEADAGDRILESAIGLFTKLFAVSQK